MLTLTNEQREKIEEAARERDKKLKKQAIICNKERIATKAGTNYCNYCLLADICDKSREEELEEERRAEFNAELGAGVYDLP